MVEKSIDDIFKVKKVDKGKAMEKIYEKLKIVFDNFFKENFGKFKNGIR